MNNQQIFSKVYHHLIAQNCKSVHVGTLCAYRGQNGTKCAVGCLILDQYYDPVFEGRGISRCQHPASKALFDALEKSGIPAESDELLYTLQGVHDSWPPEKWASVLATVASQFGLVIP